MFNRHKLGEMIAKIEDEMVGSRSITTNTRTPLRILLAVFASISQILAISLPLTASSLSRPYVDLVDAFIVSEADRDSQRNQVDATSLADNAATLVEHSSIPDFIGMAIDPGFLKVESDSEEERNNSYTGTITLNTFIAALRGTAPGHEDFFYRGGGFQGFARGTAFIAGYDDPTTDDQRPARRFGFKTRLLGDAAVELDPDTKKPRRGLARAPEGLWFFKTMPARVLARPARAVFRPQDLEVARPTKDEACSRQELSTREIERCRFDELVKAAKSAASAEQDKNRWGQKVCEGTASPRGETIPRMFHVGPDANRLDRLERAYALAAAYLEHLICDGRALRPLVGGDGPPGGSKEPDKRQRFLSILAASNWRRPARGEDDRLPRPQENRGMPISAEEAPFLVELVMEELLTDAESWKPECDREFSRLVGPPANCTSEQTFANQARAALRSIQTEGVLTPLGSAVVQWALGDERGAILALRKVIEGLGQEESEERRLRDFRTAAGNLRDEINKRTELSFEYQTSRRRGLEDRHFGTLVLEASPLQDCTLWGSLDLRSGCDFWRRLDLTLNAGFDIEDDHETDEAYGGGAALEISIPVILGAMLPGETYSPAPDETEHRFSLSTRARWLEGGNDQYVGQAKFTFNFSGAISVPLIFTVADRSALDADTDLRGQLGLSIDTSKLFDAFRSRLAPAATTQGSGS